MPKLTLKAARVNAKLTQSQAAEKSGYSLSTIQNWENGKTFPKQPAIETLCIIYGVQYDHIDFASK